MKLDNVKSTGLELEARPAIKKVGMTNIPTNSLILLDKTTDSNYRMIRQVKTATLQLTGFAISQFLEGAELEANSNLFVPNNSQFKLVLKLSKSISMLQAEQAVKIDVNYKELTHLRKWLEVRMSHCEQERNARTKNDRGFEVFNSDTYIGQKLLLLDLRELMLGEIISE